MNIVWEKETFESLLNSGMFKVTDYGPLYSPITSLEIKRNDKKELILTTYSGRNSQKDKHEFDNLPSGSIHSLTDGITLFGADMTVIAKGVWSRGYYVEPDLKTKTCVRKEISWVKTLEAIPENTEQVHQLIEWVENLDTSLYFWPHSLSEKREISATRIFNNKNEELKQHIKQPEYFSARGCLCVNIDGNEIYIASFEEKESKRPNGPGFILYQKFLCEDVRRKIRECLSFTFGVPIIYLGYTLLSRKYEFIGFKAVTPHIIDESIFSRQALPPVPVGEAAEICRRINPIVFSRTVNALFAHYDDLNFRQLSWDYWHAIFSPTHAQPVLLGACIEAIQANYKKLVRYNSKLLDEKNAKYLRDEFQKIVDSMPIREEDKKVLKNKANDLNNLPQRILNERFFARLSLEMSDKEKKAWARRNEAAHGKERIQGDHEALMKDVNLLMNILHRIIISITDANSQYIDCYTPGYPVRQLRESVEAQIRFYSEM
ncbi:MAG: hypothetical protein LZF61_11095 [Nitrosomonas sp.]|nr:MAG: hypothetical protein LZF61_11095 [Nitrosomonas sp.]